MRNQHLAHKRRRAVAVLLVFLLIVPALPGGTVCAEGPGEAVAQAEGPGEAAAQIEEQTPGTPTEQAGPQPQPPVAEEGPLPSVPLPEETETGTKTELAEKEAETEGTPTELPQRAVYALNQPALKLRTSVDPADPIAEGLFTYVVVLRAASVSASLENLNVWRYEENARPESNVSVKKQTLYDYTYNRGDNRHTLYRFVFEGTANQDYYLYGFGSSRPVFTAEVQPPANAAVRPCSSFDQGFVRGFVTYQARSRDAAEFTAQSVSGAALCDPSEIYDGFKVTLFNYEGNAFNANTNPPPQLYMRDALVGGFVNPGDREGLVTAELEGGLPVVKEYSAWGTRVAQGAAAALFDPNAAPEGRQAYTGVTFQLLKKDDGYYEYDSRQNHAQYDPDTNTLKLYRQTLGYYCPYDSTSARADAREAGFWPFNDIRTALQGDPGNADAADYVIPGMADMHFGLVMDFDFIMPKDGMLGTANGLRPMTFDFSGDDDLWVFIDGKLVLDLGGIHGAQNGSIDFARGTVTGRTGRTQDSEVLQGLQKYCAYNMKIFYLERGAGLSNCRIRLNIPTVPKDSVSVTKQVKGDVNPGVAEEDYPFVLYRYDDENNPLRYTGPYTLDGEARATGNDGIMRLGEGQTATVPDIEDDERYYFAELSDSTAYSTGWRYGEGEVFVLCESQTGERATQAIPADLCRSVVFLNDYSDAAPLQELRLVKEFDGEGEFPFELSFNGRLFETTAERRDAYIIGAMGAPEYIDVTKGRVDLAAGELLGIKSLPVGTLYNIRELTGEGYINEEEYDPPEYALSEGPGSLSQSGWSAAGALGDRSAGGSPHSIICKNTRKPQNIYTLILQKRADEDTVFDATQSARDSFLFKITHYPPEGEPRVFYETIQAGGPMEKTITGLFPGRYEVEEVQGWSWRYEPVLAYYDSGDLMAGEIGEHLLGRDGYASITVRAHNRRTKYQWLSGDNAAINLFTGEDANEN